MSAPVEPVNVFFVLPRGSLILDWAGPAEALRFANTELPPRRPAFALHFVAPEASSRSSVGAMVAGLAPLPERPRPGGGIDQHAGPAVFVEQLAAAAAGRQRPPVGVDDSQRQQPAAPSGDGGADHSAFGAETQAI